MDTPKELVRLLGLTAKERKVLRALKEGATTPLQISRETKVTRPAVYAALTRFKERGIATTRIVEGRKYWSLAKQRDLEEVLYDTKRYLADIAEGVEEVHGKDDATVVVHRGAEAIIELLRGIVRDHKHERLYAIQGNVVTMGWNKVVGVDITNELNRYIKKNTIITEAILPDQWFEDNARVMGKQWLIDFEGRASAGYYADPAYFEHGGQIWMFKHSLYLIAMHEEIVIEVRNSEMQKLVLSMFRFMAEHSRRIDVNAVLRELIANESKQS